MKTSQILVAAFAGLAVARLNIQTEGEKNALMTQAKVVKELANYDITNCNEDQGGINCATYQLTANDVPKRKDHLSVLCRDKGGCINCKIADEQFQTRVSCEFGSQEVQDQCDMRKISKEKCKDYEKQCKADALGAGSIAMCVGIKVNSE